VPSGGDCFYASPSFFRVNSGVVESHGGGLTLRPRASASAGSSLSLTGGTAGGTNQNGGPVRIDGGAATGTGTSGQLLIGSTRTTNVSVTGAITASGLMCAGTYTVATLPSASANTYKFANVSDSLVPVLGANVAAGGSAKASVWSDGVNWKVFAL
jgi:hypothetical protein